MLEWFEWRSSKTPERCQTLDSHTLPHYMRLGVEYTVIGKPIPATIDTPLGKAVFVYLISELKNAGKTHFIHTPYTLPNQFWVRVTTGKLIDSTPNRWLMRGTSTRHDIQYEILDISDDGTPKQILRMNAPVLKVPEHRTPVILRQA